MARKTRSERVSQVLDFIKDDVDWRKKWAGADQWDRYESYYRGYFPKAQGTEKTVIPDNVFFPVIRGIVAQTYFRNPGCTVSSHMPTSYARSKILERLDLYLLQVLNAKAQFRALVQDCVMYGTAFLVHGYDSEHGIPLPLPVGKFTTKGGKVIEYNKDVRPGHPWSLRAHPSDILLPWGCASSSDLRRFTLRKMRLLADVKEDERYNAGARGKLEASKLDYFSDDVQTGTNEEWVFTYEQHDLRDGMVRVVADGLDMFLLEEEDIRADVLRQLPLGVLIWNPNPKSIWGIPETKIMEHTQSEVNVINTLASRSRKINIPKFVFDMDEVDPEELEAFLSEDVGAGFGVHGSPRDIIADLTARVDGGLSLEVERIKQQGRAQIGFSETRAGAYTYPTKRVTAREVEAVEGGTQLQEGARRDAVSELLKETISHWNKFVFQFWDKPMFIYAPEIEPGIDYVIFKGQDLAGTYEYSINPEELRPPNHEMQRQEAAVIGPQLLQLAGKIPDVVNAQEVLREVLSRFPGWDVKRIMGMAGPVQGQGGVALLDPSGILRPMGRMG